MSCYKAHINIKICASIYTIKYISKYIYKGLDYTMLKLDLENNKVNLYLQYQYYGLIEGYW
jgi:hypothetical protein